MNVAHSYELHGNPQLLSGALDRAFHDVLGLELLPRLAHILGLALEGEGRRLVSSEELSDSQSRRY